MLLCDRMLDLGVIVQPTGDHLNIRKIKPPLCIDTTAADFFADMLDLALTRRPPRTEDRPGRPRPAARPVPPSRWRWAR